MTQRDVFCSFCRKSYRDVGPLVEGPKNVFICGECIELSQSIIKQETRRRSQSAKPDSAAFGPYALVVKLNQIVNGQEEAKQALVHRKAKCSFCRKSNREVGPLVEGPKSVYVCGECLELSQSIIEQEIRRRNQSAEPKPSAIEPGALLTKLNQLISGQEEAKQALVQSVGHEREGSARVLLVGPPSSGIFLTRALAHVLNAPFASGIASELIRSHDQHLSPTVYKLLLACDFDIESAKHGVVYLAGADQENEQRAFVRLCEEKVVSVGGRSEFDTREMLFVCGGTFAGLDQAIAKCGRHAEQPITVDALIAVGAQPEWVRLLRGIARVTPLDEQTLVKIAAHFDFNRVESFHSADANRGA